MDDKTLRNMKQTIDKADKIQNRIKTIDNTLDKLRIAGKVITIEISYPTTSKALYDDEEEKDVTGYVRMDAKLLGLTNEAYSEIFKKVTIEALEKLKSNCIEEYKNL